MFKNKKLKVNEDIKNIVDDMQLKVIESPVKNTCVFAVAGSGKTTTLKYRIQTMIENGIPENEMLLLTFTNKAANEMTERIKDALKKDTLDLTSGTFHSVASKIIRSYMVRMKIGRVKILDEKGAYAIFAESVENICLENENQISTIYIREIMDFKILYGLYSKIKNFRLNPDEIFEEFYKTIKKRIQQKERFETKNGEILYQNDILEDFNSNKIEYFNKFKDIIKKYGEEKRKDFLFDFDDLIETWIKILRNPEFCAEINDRYKYIFVDEYQDINEYQYEILKRLTGPNCVIFVIGDSNQCIYQFRGSNDKYIDTFKKDYKDVQEFELNYNYRSISSILECAEIEINKNERNQKRKVNLISKSTNQDGIVKFIDIKNDTEMQNKIISLLNKEIKANTLENNVILTRVKKGTKEMEKIMIKNQIPYYIVGSQGFYEYRRTRMIVNVVYSVLTGNSSSLIYISALYENVSSTAAKEASVYFKQFKTYKGLSDTAKKTKYKKIFFSELEKMESIKDPIEIIKYSAPHILENLKYEIEKNKKIKKQMKEDQIKDLESTFYNDIDFIISDINTFENFNEFYESRIINIALNKDIKIDTKNKVGIMTIHASKGLEWERVIIPYVSDGVIPHQLTLEDSFRGNGLEDERKLFYVALTRAKKELYLIHQQSCPIAGYRYKEPSPFVINLIESGKIETDNPNKYNQQAVEDFEYGLDYF